MNRFKIRSRHVAIASLLVAAIATVAWAGEKVFPTHKSVSILTMRQMEKAVLEDDSTKTLEYAQALYLLQAGELVQPVVDLKREFEPQLALAPTLIRKLAEQFIEDELSDDCDKGIAVAAQAFLEGNGTTLAAAMDMIQEHTRARRIRYEKQDSLLKEAQSKHRHGALTRESAATYLCQLEALGASEHRTKALAMVIAGKDIQDYDW